MEAVGVLGFFVALAVAAALWGNDSREGLRSKEQELAAFGLSWLDVAEARGAVLGARPGKNGRAGPGERFATAGCAGDE